LLRWRGSAASLDLVERALLDEGEDILLAPLWGSPRRAALSRSGA
jgi:hypothetical protein